MSQRPQPLPTLSGDHRIVIGIDWADREHSACLIDPHLRQPLYHTLPQQPEAIAQWAAELRARYPDRPLCVSLETSQGPLFQALLAAGGFTLFPVNPKQLARFRQVFSPTGQKDDRAPARRTIGHRPEGRSGTGQKDDRADAELLAHLLLQHSEQLRACRPDDELTRRLARLTELRRTLVEQQKSGIQQLAAALKLYFPLLVQLFGGKLQQPLVLALLQRWPTLSAVRRVAGHAAEGVGGARGPPA